MELQFLKEEEIKQQLLLDDDIFYGSQNVIIETMAQSAEELALKFIGKSVEELTNENGGRWPKSISMACLSEIASNFDVRENEAERSARTLRITNYKRWQGALLPYRDII